MNVQVLMDAEAQAPNLAEILQLLPEKERSAYLQAAQATAQAQAAEATALAKQGNINYILRMPPNERAAAFKALNDRPGKYVM